MAEEAVWDDALISNSQGNPPNLNANSHFLLTFTGLDDSLLYNLEGGFDNEAANGGNNNFAARWTADGQTFTTLPRNGTGYGSLSGLVTDGSGNLVIRVNRTTTHVTVAGLTLEAGALRDSDGDLIDDAYEFSFFPDDLDQLTADGDLDMDGLSDVEEFNLRNAFEGTFILDPSNPDSDDDGLEDGVESNSGTYIDQATDTGTNPIVSDTDGDGFWDGAETNDDANPGQFIFVSYDFSTNRGDTGTDPLLPDSDEDTLLDGEEPPLGANPNLADTDNDTFNDAIEAQAGSLPNDPTNTPGLGGYAIASGNWQSAAEFGSFDINGDGLGSDGFIFFGAFDGVQDPGEPFTENVTSDPLPPYITSLAESDTVAIQVASGFAGYGLIDDPNLLDGTDQIAGFAHTGNVSATAMAGDSFEILTFTVSGVIPGESTIRVGVLGGVARGARGENPFDPSAITLTGPSGSETRDNAGDELSGNPDGINVGWVFFDITEDGTFSVSSTFRTGTDIRGTGIGGLTFDSIGNFNFLDPPSHQSLRLWIAVSQETTSSSKSMEPQLG